MIKVTDEAAKKITHLLKETSEYSNSYLRVSVVKGGCTGLSYKLDFEKDTLNGDDKVLNDNGIEIVIDKKSFELVDGMTLNFSGGLNGQGFEFSNPNASRTCGCGTIDFKKSKLG